MNSYLASATRRWLLAAIAVVAVVVGSAMMRLDQVDASAGDGGFIDHATLVPEIPETGYPRILYTPVIPATPVDLHRETMATDLIGNYIISGGNFVDIELQNGTVISQPNLAVFDTVTKDLVCDDLDANGNVLAISRGHEPDSVIIGGKFTNLTDANGTHFRQRIAKIDLDTCTVDPDWSIANIDARVTELAVNGNRLFIGGDFTMIGASAIGNLAEVNLADGVVNTALDFDFTGANPGRVIMSVEPKPDGTRLGVVHKATHIDGAPIRVTAVFDISDPAAPSLTAHRTADTAWAWEKYYKITEGGIAPDFSRFVIAQGTATGSDWVSAVPTTEAADQFDWAHFMRDSSFGVAISNNAVYVSGHFCRINSGPGTTVEMTPNILDECTGVWIEGDPCCPAPGAWRSQLAALDPVDGTPLEWNPGSNALVGGRSLTVVNRGLLIGYDGDRINSFRVGTTAFLDFGATTDPRTNQNCVATVAANGVDVDVSWDPVNGVADFDVIRNDEMITSTQALTHSDAPGFGTWDYAVRSVLNGTVWDTPCSPTVTLSPGCTALLNADDTITITWDLVPGTTDYSVRRNAAWIANDPGPTYTDNPGAGTWDYEIRYWTNGTLTDITCTPQITITPPAVTCTAVIDQAGAQLDWTAVPGVTTYVVRKNGAWLATVNNVVTFLDPTGVAGDQYVIRYWQGGQTDIACV